MVGGRTTELGKTMGLTSAKKVNSMGTKVGYALGLFGIVLMMACGNDSLPKESLPEATYQYGIQVDSFSVIKGQVQPGQALGSILYLHHIDHPKIDQIVRASKEIFDFRTARAGKSYTVLCSKDSLEVAQCFIYEESATSFVVFDLRDSLHVYRGQ